MIDLEEKELLTSEKKTTESKLLFDDKAMTDYIMKTIFGSEATPASSVAIEPEAEMSGTYTGAYISKPLPRTYSFENPDVPGDYITLEEEELMRKLFCMRDIEKVYKAWYPKIQCGLITGEEYSKLPMRVIKEVFTPFLVDEFSSAIRKNYQEFSDLFHRYIGSGEYDDPDWDGSEIYITWQYIDRAIKKLSLDREIIKNKITQECGALIVTPWVKDPDSTVAIIDIFKQTVRNYIDASNKEKFNFDWTEIFQKLFYADITLKK